MHIGASCFILIVCVVPALQFSSVLEHSSALGSEKVLSLFEMCYALYESAALHCEDTVTDEARMLEWRNLLGGFMAAEPAAGLRLLEMVLRPRPELEEPEEDFGLVMDEIGPQKPGAAVEKKELEPEEDEDALPNTCVLVKAALQGRYRAAEKSVRASIIGVIADAAESVLAQHGPDSPTSSHVMTTIARILASAKAAVADRLMLEGWVALFAELAQKPSLKQVAVSMDVLAYFIHIYLANNSPATEWKDEPCTAAVTNKPLPKLPANVRRSAMASYNLGPLHDHRPLLRVLTDVLRDNTAPLPPLTTRLLRHPVFMKQLFEMDVVAGAKPLPPIVYTPEEENRLLAAEGWTRYDVEGTRPYWYKHGHKSMWEKPKPRKPSTTEMERRMLVAAEPEDLLATLMFLRDDLQEFVVSGLLMAVEKTYPGNSFFNQRATVLKMILSVDTEGRAERVDLVSRRLVERMACLRDGTGPDVESLAKHEKWQRMQALVRVHEELREAALLGSGAQGLDLSWLDAWGDAHRVRLRISLDDLQGHWTNSEVRGSCVWLYVCVLRC